MAGRIWNWSEISQMLGCRLDLVQTWWWGLELVQGLRVGRRVSAGAGPSRWWGGRELVRDIRGSSRDAAGAGPSRIKRSGNLVQDCVGVC